MAQRLTESVSESQYERVVPVEDGAEAFVEVLNANGVEFIFLAPGTDTIAVQEAIARMRNNGRKTPGVILALHESFGMAAAHGHFMVSGRPQVCMVHVDVGTQNIGGAIQNAFKSEVGVLVCSGITPYTTDGEERAGRTGIHNWLQEPMIQASSVRENVKWLYELRTARNINQIVQRALQIASTEPCGPTYLMLPRERMMEPLATAGILPPGRYGPPATPMGDPDLLTEAAEILVRAKHPLILTSRLGRNTAAVAPLIELADLLAIPVVELRDRMNFPLDHPMHLGFSPQRHLKEADAILELDQPVPYAPSGGRPRPDAKIIRLAMDPVAHTYPLWSFPADLAVPADTAKALPFLTAAARDMIQQADHERIEERRRALTIEHDAMLARWDDTATSSAQRRPIHSAWLCKCIYDVIGPDALYLQEALTNAPSVLQQIRASKPGTFFYDSAASLGWVMGAALGAKLAAPDRDVVCLVGDGSFHFASPLACLWAADVYKAPFLTVVINNARLGAVWRSISSAYPDGHGRHANADVGHHIPHPPQYELVARSCHAYAETITDPAEIRPAVERALAEIRGGRAALLDVIVE